MGQLISLQPLYILSGAREIGKTTFLKTLLEQAALLKLDAAGVISPAFFSAGEKKGIDLLEVRSGITKRLANLRESETCGIQTERWAFSSEVLDWGNQVLGNSCPCDLLIVDELGPIELERGQGWQNGIRALSSGNYQTAVVVIRPELVEKAFQIWPNARLIQIIQKNHRNQHNQIERILSSIKPTPKL